MLNIIHPFFMDLWPFKPYIEILVIILEFLYYLSLSSYATTTLYYLLHLQNKVYNLIA